MRKRLELNRQTSRSVDSEAASVEIHAADPATRRLALIGLIVIRGLGLIPLLWVQRELDTISGQRHTDPLEATRRMLAVSRLLGASVAVVCLATGIWLAQLGFRIRRAERFSLPDARVVRDTPVLTGAAARRQASIALVVALALLAAASWCRRFSCVSPLCSPRARAEGQRPPTGRTDDTLTWSVD